jgi:DnaK suppressor protein
MNSAERTMKNSTAMLTLHERESLRKALERKLKELRHAADYDVSTGTHPEDSYTDPMDAASRATDEDELLARADHERTLAVEVERALDKMKSGTYGVSELSGKPIALARLRAVPWARLTREEEEGTVRS